VESTSEAVVNEGGLQNLLQRSVDVQHTGGAGQDFLNFIPKYDPKVILQSKKKNILY
jgi:hypothetical protein